jgi:hypothetical protein
VLQGSVGQEDCRNGMATGVPNGHKVEYQHGKSVNDRKNNKGGKVKID